MLRKLFGLHPCVVRAGSAHWNAFAFAPCTYSCQDALLKSNYFHLQDLLPQI